MDLEAIRRELRASLARAKREVEFYRALLSRVEVEHVPPANDLGKPRAGEAGRDAGQGGTPA